MNAKVVHDRLFIPLGKIHPSPENALLYRPVTPDDAETIELADSIRERGILEPIVVSEGRYIISGHRRHCAGRIAGLREIPCRMLDIRRGDGEKASDEFLKLLREHNRQRIKSREENVREAIISVDRQKAHRALTAYRRLRSKIKVAPIEIRDVQRRKEISPAKSEFLQAVLKVIREQAEFWPLSLRQIHYQLLNDPPLIHSAKPDSRYRNI